MESVDRLRERFMDSRPAPLPIEAREAHPRRRRHSEFMPVWGWWVIGAALGFLAATVLVLRFGEETVLATLPVAVIWCGIALSSLVFLAALLLIYFIPAMIAFHYGIRRKYAVTALNLFLGWTFLGWAGAMVWAIAEAESS